LPDTGKLRKMSYFAQINVHGAHNYVRSMKNIIFRKQVFKK